MVLGPELPLLLSIPVVFVLILILEVSIFYVNRLVCMGSILVIPKIYFDVRWSLKTCSLIVSDSFIRDNLR